MLDSTNAASDNFMHSAEGVDRAEDLARHTMSNLVVMADLADVDPTITSLFLLVEVLAALQVHVDLAPDAALAQVPHLIERRIAELRDQVDECPCMEDEIMHADAPATIN